MTKSSIIGLENSINFRELFSDLPVPLVVTDYSGKIIQYNSFFLKFLNLKTRKNLSSTNLKDLIVDDNNFPKKDKLDILNNGDGEYFTWKTTFKIPGGINKKVSVRSKILRGEKSNKNHLLNYISGIELDLSLDERLDNKENFEIKYSDVFDDAHDAIILYDPKNHRILQANREAEYIYGYKKDEMLGLSIEELSVESEKITKKIESIYNEEVQQQFNLVHKRKDGFYIKLAINSTLINFDGRKGLLFIIKDVSDKSVRRMKKFYTLFNNLLQGVLIINKDGIIEEVNEAASKMVGVPYKELVDTSIYDVRWNVRDENGNELNKEEFPAAVVINKQVEVRNKVLCVYNDILKEYIWLSATASPIEFDIKTVDKVILTLNDITELKKKEIELQRSREKFSASVETMPLPFVILEAMRNNEGNIYDFKYVYANDATVDSNQIPKEGTIGNTMLTLYPDHKISGVFDGFVNTVETGEPYFNKELLYEGKHKNTFYKGYFEMRANKFEDGVVAVWQEVTERKEYERHLEFHSKIVDNLSEGVILINPQNEIISYNDAAEKILGYKYEEVKNRNIFKMLHLITKTDDWKIILREILDKEFHTTETVLKRKDGKHIDVETTAFTISDRQNVEGYVIILRDITARKSYELDLKERESNFRALAENTNDQITRLDCNLNYLYVNPKVEEFTGRPASELIGKNVKEISLNIPDRNKLHESIKKVFENGKPEFTEYKFEGENENLVFSTHIIPEFSEDKKTVRSVIVISRDITKLKETEQDVKTAYTYLENIINTIRDPLLVLDVNLELLSANKSFYDLYKTDQIKAVGQKIDNLMNVTHNAEHVSAKIRRAFEEELLDDLEVEVQIDEKEKKIFNVKANPIKEKNKTPLLLMSLNDITDLKRAENRSSRLIKELERSNQDLEQFAYVASHDLQEPLRMVESYTALLEERYFDKLDRDGKDFIEFARDGATRMQALIKDLLLYSRIVKEKKEFTNVDLNEVLKDVFNNLQFTIEDTKPEISYPKNLPAVKGYKETLVSLFQNLLSNSIKYRSERQLKIEIKFEKIDHFYKFAFSDNGIGISREHLDKIFNLFHRVHGRAKYSGTGIGLALCKKIVENHGGRIWVESLLDKGTTFYFTLPDDRI